MNLSRGDCTYRQKLFKKGATESKGGLTHAPISTTVIRGNFLKRGGPRICLGVVRYFFSPGTYIYDFTHRILHLFNGKTV